MGPERGLRVGRACLVLHDLNDIFSCLSKAFKPGTYRGRDFGRDVASLSLGRCLAIVNCMEWAP
jgi:hypothetical protein